MIPTADREFAAPAIMPFAALACIVGPGIVSLIPLAPAAALPQLAARFAPGAHGALLAQMVLAAPAGMLIVTAPLAGLLAERLGAKRVLLAALVLFAVAGSSALWATSLPFLVAGRLGLGAAGGAILSASLMLIGSTFAGTAREWILGLATSLSAVVAMVALVGGGVLVDAFGWRGPFGLYLVGLPAALLVALALPGIAAQPSASADGTAPGLSPLWPILLLLVASAVVIFVPSLQASLLLAERFALSGSAVGLTLATAPLVSILSAGCYGWLRQHLSVRRVFAVNIGGFALGLLAIAFAQSPWQAALGCALIGFGGGTTEPAAASAALARLPAAQHGRASGVIVSGVFLGQFLNPLIIAPLRTMLGISVTLVLLGAGMLLLAAFLTWPASDGNHPRVAPPRPRDRET